MQVKQATGPLILMLLTMGIGYGQTTPAKPREVPEWTIDKATRLGSEYDLIRPLVGTWRVQQRNWTKAGAQPVVSPPFQVRRQLIGHFLQEIMEPMAGTPGEPFTRMMYLNFSNANHRWEITVLDTRYPVTMFETSNDAMVEKNQLTLYLDSFVMPPMAEKEVAGQLARQRRTFTFVGPDQQISRQYWTLPTKKEYLAIEYIYTRQPAKNLSANQK